MTVIQLEQGSTLMIHSTLITSFLHIQPGWVLEFQHKNSGETQIFKPRQHIKKQRCYFANKGPYSQSYGFFSSYAWMWELDDKKDWALKHWCLWNVMLEETLESSLDSKEIKPVNPKENQPWIFIGKTGDEAEAPILWPPNVKNWLIRREPDSGKDWRQDKKRTGWDGWMASLTQWTWNWKWRLLSHVLFFATSWTIQSIEFSRPECWSG